MRFELKLQKCMIDVKFGEYCNPERTLSFGESKCSVNLKFACVIHSLGSVLLRT